MVGHCNIKKYYQHSTDYLETLKQHNDKTFTEYLNTVKKYVTKGSTILEIGCGTGQSSKLISEYGYNVTGVEISELFLKESAGFMSCKLKYCVADAEKLPFGDHIFNAVVAYDVIEHIENIDRVLKELDRVLKPSGILLIISPNFFKIHKPFILYHCFTNKELPGWTTGGFLTKLRYDMITYFGILTKPLFRRPYFYKRRPNLNGDIVGKDVDSVYMTSPIDLYKFFQAKYIIINYQGKEKNVRIFLDSLRGQTKIVFKKTKENAIEMYNSIRPHGTFWEKDLIFARFIKLYSFALSIAKAEFPNGGNVLDAATGLGYGAEMLSNHFEHVVGIDLSKEVLNYARAKYKRPKFQKGNVLSMPFSVNSFEAVFSIETLEHLAKKDLHVFVDELLRVTKPGGLIFISIPNKPVYSSLHEVEDHYSELTLSELKSLIKNRYGGDIKYYEFGTRVGKNLKILNSVGRFSKVARRVLARTFRMPFPHNIGFEDALNFWTIKAIAKNCESYGYLNIAVISKLKK